MIPLLPMDTARLIPLIFLLCASAQAFQFTVLHTNDLHSHFEGSGPDALFTAKAGDGDPVVGHYARLATLIRQTRNRKKQLAEPVLLLDAGDFFSGSLFQTLGPATDSPSVPELEFFHRLAYDGVTFGNHEFDAGNSGLATMLAKAKFDLGYLVLSNRAPSPGSAVAKVASEIVREFISQGKTVRIGILGFLSPDAARDSASNRGPTHVVGFDDTTSQPQLQDFLVHAQQRAAFLRQARAASLVIALIHGGAPQDEALAKVPGIDLVISGHTHQLYSPPRQIGRTLVAQSGYYGRHLGILELETSDSGLQLRNASATHLTADDSVAADPEILALVSSYKKEVNARLVRTGMSYATPIVELSHSLMQGEPTNEDLGRLVTSAVQQSLNQVTSPPADVYFTSQSLIRENLLAVNGKATAFQFSDIFRLLPTGFGDGTDFGSPIVSATFSKADFLRLLHLLELYRWISPHFALVFSDSLTFRRDPAGLPFVNRLKDIRLNGKSMDEVGPWIRVATNAYCAGFFPRLSALSHQWFHFQLRDPAGLPIASFRREPVPSEPFLFSNFLKTRTLRQ